MKEAEINSDQTATSQSYGGSSLSFQTRAFRGYEVHLNAFPRGLHLTVTSRNDGRVIAAQLIQWAQVAAWMEAARGADGHGDPVNDLMNKMNWRLRQQRQ